MTTTDPAADSHPWDQKRGESDDAYAHFMVYLNHGPARSLESAYASWVIQKNSRTAENSEKQPPKTWWSEAKRFDWRSRPPVPRGQRLRRRRLVPRREETGRRRPQRLPGRHPPHQQDPAGRPDGRDQRHAGPIRLGLFWNSPAQPRSTRMG